MIISEAGYILTSHELMLLAAAVGGYSFLGFKYEADVKQEMAEQLWKNTMTSLQEKNFIFDGANGYTSIDKQLTDCMEACVRPEYFLSCRVRADDEETFCCYYAAKGKFVKLEKNEAVGDQCILTPLKSLIRLNISIHDIMDLEGSYLKPDVTPELLLTPEYLNMIIELDSIELKHMDFIKEATLTDDLFADMINAVKNHENTRTLLLMQMNAKKQEDLFVYAGKYLWRLTKGEYNEESMKLTIITPESYTNELNRILDLINTHEVSI